MLQERRSETASKIGFTFAMLKVGSENIKFFRKAAKEREESLQRMSSETRTTTPST